MKDVSLLKLSPTKSKPPMTLKPGPNPPPRKGFVKSIPAKRRVELSRSHQNVQLVNGTCVDATSGRRDGISKQRKGQSFWSLHSNLDTVPRYALSMQLVHSLYP